MKVLRALGFAIICFISGLGSRLCAEVYLPIPSGPSRVISTEGLSLRAKPSKESARLEVIPFGSRLIVLENAHPKLDSLPALMGLTYESEGAVIQNRIARVGFWAKVNWHGKTGYVLDIFLLTEKEYTQTDALSAEQAPSNINSEVQLMEIGSTCIANLPTDPNFHWTGVYVNGTTVELKPAKLHQHVARIDAVVEAQMFVATYSDDNQGLMYLIGKRKASTEMRATPLLYIQKMGFPGEGTPRERAAFFATLGIRFDTAKIEPAEEGATELKIFNGGGLEQTLNLANPQFSYDPILAFVADLDGDNRHDYVVMYGEGKGGTVLFLSSWRQKGQLVAPVSIWHSTYCC